MESEKKGLASLTLFLIVFIDMLGVGIIIPILAPLFVDMQTSFLPATYSLAHRTLLLGLLIAMYPLTQFFGAPVLGALSDKYGRRKLLALALAGTVAGYIFFGFGILKHNLGLLFLGRLVDGFTGGNIAIVYSALADISDEKQKARNFGMVGMAFGLGFILGPFIGGKLADPSFVSWFNYATPLWFAALLAFIDLMLVLTVFKETLQLRREVKLSFLTGVRNIQKALSMPRLRTMLMVVFLLTFGFNFYTQFFQVFLIDKFHFISVQIGNFFAYIGIWIAFTQGGLNRFLTKKFSSQHIITFSLMLLSVALLLMLLPTNANLLYLISPLIAISFGLTYPNAVAMVSNLAGKEYQGEIMGINQSFQSLAMAIPPVIAGLIVTLHRNLPILVASFFVFLSWIVFILFFRKEKVIASAEAVGMH